jgi:acetoacetyl-CoA reductase
MPGLAPGIFISVSVFQQRFKPKAELRQKTGTIPAYKEDHQGGLRMARVALVTGGTRGIGASISKALKAAGYKVAASYAGNDAAAEKFKSETGIPVYKWDVSSFDACAAGVKQVEADIGPVDVLINNAGITKDGAFHKMTLDQWNAVINTNLGSLFNMTRQVIEGMRARKFGRVINISSINGQKGQFGQVNYSAAKAGMHGFTMALAQEVASKGVTVNTVSPGYIATDMVMAVREDVREKIIQTIPVKRLGKAEEIGSIVGWLTTDDGGFTSRGRLLLQWRPAHGLSGGAFCCLDAAHSRERLRVMNPIGLA